MEEKIKEYYYINLRLIVMLTDDTHIRKQSENDEIIMTKLCELIFRRS